MLPDRTRWPLAAALALTAVLAAAPSAAARTSAQPPFPGRWVGSWETAPVIGLVNPGDVASRYSVRNVVHISVGGRGVRIHLSNRFGTAPLELGHVTVGLQASGASAAGGTLREVTFRGAPSATVRAGADLISDPVPLSVPDAANLLITAYLPAVSGPVTTHQWARQTSYFAVDGDHAGDESGSAYTGTTGHWNYVTGVDVRTPFARGSVVAFGDSITDGYSSTVDADHRWPDYLAARLRHRPPGLRSGVLNAGISGNRLLADHSVYGTNALDRLDADALSQAGVRTLIVLEGINDIQLAPHETDPARIEGALRRITERAHARGIRVIVGTLTPFKGFWLYDPSLEPVRQAVNTFIRTSGIFDGVVDFDAVLRDPADPQRLLPAYDSGDHIHPNDSGDKAMADAVTGV